MSPVALLFDGARRVGSRLVAGSSEPSAELLALVWGSRFDREHASSLMRRAAGLQPDAVATVMRAADSFDGLPHARQQRIRGLIAKRLAPQANADGPATMPA